MKVVEEITNYSIEILSFLIDFIKSLYSSNVNSFSNTYTWNPINMESNKKPKTVQNQDKR